MTWSDCSVTCDIGIRVRERICMNGLPGDPGCPGQDTEEAECNLGVSIPFSPTNVNIADFEVAQVVIFDIHLPRHPEHQKKLKYWLSML